MLYKQGKCKKEDKERNGEWKTEKIVEIHPSILNHNKCKGIIFINYLGRCCLRVQTCN